MHDIEPYYNWQHIYVSEDDLRSPFYKRAHSEFEFSNTVYNFYIHPQWDDFGSKTLYLKVLLADYDEQYCIIEMIGEWNDAIENDIKTLRDEVLDCFLKEGISKFIFITENVLNYHSGSNEYYEELQEELIHKNGWMVCLNQTEAAMHDFKEQKLERYINLIELENWRIYKPYHLFKKVMDEVETKLLH